MPTLEHRAVEFLRQAEALRKIAAEMKTKDPKTAADLVEMASFSEKKAIELRAMRDGSGAA